MINKGSFIEKKGDIRKKIKRRLREQGSEGRTRRSRIIQDKLLENIQFRECSFVMIYVSLPEEVDTAYFIGKALKLGKRIAVPYIQRDNDELKVSELTSMENLEEGPYGIYQPGQDQI